MREVRPRLNTLAGGAIVVIIAFWPLTLFDISAPNEAGRIPPISYLDDSSAVDDWVTPSLYARWPAGIYIGSVLEAVQHGRDGHWGYLWGDRRLHGFWYYFPAVALYKVPLGVALVILLAALSLMRVRPRWDELALVLPMAACGLLIMMGTINLGFRHALPTYGLLLLLSSRCLADGEFGCRPPSGWMITAWLGVLAAGAHAVSYHPDYIAYVNGAWRRPYQAIADSNLDWGQSLKQVRRWLEANPQNGRPVHLDPFDETTDPSMSYYLGESDVTLLQRDDPAPDEGLLIVSPTHLAGVYERLDLYRHLRDLEPHDVIGHSLLVFDLDRLRAEQSPELPD
jgi:hypothetical protein